MNEKEFIQDLWAVLTNTEHITIEQFRERYKKMFVKVNDSGQSICIKDEHNEWKLSVEKVWSDAKEPDSFTDSTLDEALNYVREQIDEDDLLVIRATVTRNMSHRAPVSAGVNDGRIIDLLEEYGEDNDFAEGWWEEFGDIDEILLLL